MIYPRNFDQLRRIDMFPIAWHYVHPAIPSKTHHGPKPAGLSECHHRSFSGTALEGQSYCKERVQVGHKYRPNPRGDDLFFLAMTARVTELGVELEYLPPLRGEIRGLKLLFLFPSFSDCYSSEEK